MKLWPTFALATTLALTTLPLSAETIEGRVSKVIDGDTFYFKAIKIRICGIEAPDRGEPGFRQSTEALAALTRGRKVTCTPVGAGSVCDRRSKLFSRGRLVAQCFIGAIDIAKHMVKSGHACDWLKFSGGAYPGGCKK